MKIRTSFVSNSSSSSYILKIHNISQEQFFSIAFAQLCYNEYNEPVDHRTGKWQMNDEERKRYVIKLLTKINGWGGQKSIQIGNNQVTVIGFTSMHNSYRDMPQIMSQLYFRFLQDMKQMSFKRQDDY